MDLQTVETSVEIGRSADRIWDVLTDFAAYQEWNAFIRHIEGPLTVGADLVVHLSPPDRPVLQIPVTLTELTEPERLMLTFAGDDDRAPAGYEITIARTPAGCRVTTTQSFEPDWELADPGLRERAQLGMEMSNAALRARVER